MSEATPHLPVVPGEGPFVTPEQILFVGDRELLAVDAQLGTRSPTSEAEIYNPTNPLVVGVSSAESINRLHQITERRKVLAVIAWRIREEHLQPLYLLNIPIIVGLPTVDTFLDVVNHGLDPDRVTAARSHAAFLAGRESMFDTPANSASTN